MRRAEEMTELTYQFTSTMEAFVRNTADFFGCDRGRAIRLIEIWIEAYKNESPKDFGEKSWAEKQGDVWAEAKEKCKHIVHTETI